ncbi:VOC family protein [soil metagenome]
MPMSVPSRITLVTLGVADLARSTAFYEALGWARSAQSSDDVTFFPTNGPVLSLYGIDDLAGDAGTAADRKGFPGITIAINLGSAEAVEEAHATRIAAGGTSCAEPAPATWGGYIAYVAELDGHVWELAHNPYWPLAADGSVTLPE